jgi:hypothetical protein
MILSQTAKGPFCQSCAMPLEKASDFGTGADGRHVNDYCRYCFDRGRFTEPDITQRAMIEKCVAFITQQTTMSRREAAALMSDVIPTLKRWRDAQPDADSPALGTQDDPEHRESTPRC